MDPKDKKKSYSDLEAIVTSSDTRPRSYWNEKFIAAPTSPDPKRDNDRSEGRSSKEGILDASPVDTIPPPPPAYYLVDAKGQTQALYTLPTSASSDAGSIVNFKEGGLPASGGWWSSLGEGKRIFGMRKNVFLAVVAGVCALIFGLLTTILLVTRAEDGRDRLGFPAFSTKELLQRGDSGPLLAASDLAAMNWTDTISGTTYSGIVYQSSGATGAALMLSIKNEATHGWSTVNISASAATTTRLDVLPGTPLAAANNNGLWNIYYLTSSLTIAEVYSTDPTSPKGWLQGSFGNVLNHPTVMPWSGLGAMWQNCDACDDALFVMWQDGQSGSVVYANMTNLTWGAPVNISDNVPPGTPIAISAFTDSGVKIKTGTDHNAIRMYYAQGKDLMETIKGPLGSGKLITGNNGMSPTCTPRSRPKMPPRGIRRYLIQIESTILTDSSFVGKPVTNELQENPSPKIASLTYDPGTQGWTNNFLTFINPSKGTLTSAGWQPNQAWKVQNPSLESSPKGLDNDGFSAIAQTQGLKIYLVSPWKGEIHEFATNASDPFTWTWQDVVDLST